MTTILVIDDNPDVGEALELLFSLHGIDVSYVNSPEAGLARLDNKQPGVPIDLVIQDMNFSADTTSGEEGAELFCQIRQRRPGLPVILLTAWTSLEMAVNLVRDGAADYLAKPWDDDKLLATVRNLLELGRLVRENREIQDRHQARRSKLATEFDLCGLIYTSEIMHELALLATRVAGSDLPVLITGPNGAGKELIADIIQRNSRVPSGPYVKVNAGALPADLIEAELFGAEAGAFTGADKARAGRFEAADQGTLFLDEIGNLPPEGQVKLLRVLQTGTYERLGSTTSRQAVVRLICATNADLPALIRSGRFREDLYYRVNVIELRVPPLRERGDDILQIARNLLPPGRAFSHDAEQALLRHDWPGNVRELRNHVQRALVLATGDTLQSGDLDLPQTSSNHQPEPDEEVLRNTLDKHRGVIASAARELGLSRQALYRRMEKFGLRSGEAD